jgi:hypothetical protein
MTPGTGRHAAIYETAARGRTVSQVASEVNWLTGPSSSMRASGTVEKLSSELFSARLLQLSIRENHPTLHWFESEMYLL